MGEVTSVVIVGPAYVTTPAEDYGGTEKFGADLTDGLTDPTIVRKPLKVIYYGAGGSDLPENVPNVEFRPYTKKPIYNMTNDPKLHETIALHGLLRVFEELRETDEDHLIHLNCHPSSLVYAIARAVMGNRRRPILTTMHGSLTDLVEQYGYQSLAAERPALVTISDAQRQPMPDLNYIRTIHHGIRPTEFEFHEQPDPDGDLVFVGRIAQEKGVDIAIQAALATGRVLRIGGPVHPNDREYFEAQVKPFIDGRQIIYEGAIHRGKDLNDFLGKARAFIGLPQWPEPFGYTYIEAMMCGLPVIATPLGSLPEIVQHGRTGFLCRNFQEVTAAIEQVQFISRQACRDAAVQNFSLARMTRQYVEVYNEVLTASRR